MTPDESLPPADVQRPEPALTEAELAVMAETLEGLHRFRFLSDYERSYLDDVLRLIADLRAAKVEIARLRRALAKAEDHHDDMHDEDNDG